MIQRTLDISENLKPGKVLIIYGPRQIGKTTLINEFLRSTTLKYRYDTGDSFEIANNLSKCTYQSTDEHVDNYELIVLDEAQKIPNIGNALKLMVDRYPDRFFIATGSSSFDLANMTDESLTGRKRVLTLYPIAQSELKSEFSISELKSNLPHYLIYGSYPEILTTKSISEKENLIKLIANSYLLKDIFEFDRVKNAEPIYRLLKLLAFQVGSLVSFNEIGAQVGIDTKTVGYYIDLLVKSFVLVPLRGYSKNLRKEITKMSKYYFYDLGIRNALISNFNKLEDRNDVGALWENFLLVERLKQNNYTNRSVNYYFWRTYEGAEIDLIEESGGIIDGFEFKYKDENAKVPKDWLSFYPEASFELINKNNYLEFVL